jgi:acetyl-CoA carboxylase biotin carboxyl carrier protein
MEAVDRVRQLIEIMSQNDLAELEVEEPDLRIRIKKNVPVQFLPPGLNLAMLQQPVGPPPALQMPAAGTEAPPAPAKKAENLIEITSPMVGTFYRAGSPGAEPYVSIGSELGPETVVCIIEAMKVMNEIKAEVSGTIVEILLENAEPVEFGQVLFLVEPPKE